jgi:thiosulfate dehydrogenase (quinone) large subunit
MDKDVHPMATPTVPAASSREDLPLTPPEPRDPSRTPGPPWLGGRGVGEVALTLLRLALGVEFLWAFVDKLFGLGYATPSARAWISGGSPTKGFLSNVSSGPLRGVFNAIAGAPAADWLFMLGLLGIGAALVLGVALRPAAASGVLLLTMMWFATWPPASVAGGEPTGSTNPLIDDHVISALALIVVAAFTVHGAGYLGRRWEHLDLVQRFAWLR